MAYTARSTTWSANDTLTASALNGEFNVLINGLSDGTKDVNMSAATFASLTISGVSTFSGAVSMNGTIGLGNASGDQITFTGTVVSAILATDATYALGGTSNGWTALYLDNAATDGGSVYFDGSNASYLQSAADGASLKVGGFTSVLPNTTASVALGGSSNAFKSLLLDNGATDGGAVYFNTGTTAFIKSDASGATLATGGFTDLDHASVKAYYNTNDGDSYSTGPAIVDFEESVYDSHSAVTVGGSWHFTVPITGVYLVSSHVQFVSASYTVSDSVILSVYKNGTLYARLGIVEAGSSTSFNIGVGGSALVAASATDTIDVRVQNAKGSTALSSTATSSYIQIIKLSQ